MTLPVPAPLPQPNSLSREFKEIWLVDFEFKADPGERPIPVCLVAKEVFSGRKLRVWQDKFGPVPPYSISPDSLFVAYFASAELGCHLALGWPMPARILDLFVEFRVMTNGFGTIAGDSLLGALTHFGLDAIASAEKKEMRDLVLRGGPWSAEERLTLLDYCETDVDALEKLLPRMLPEIDLPRALLRGRYMAAVARMEYTGTPIDLEILAHLREKWTDIQDQLIAAIDVHYGIYDGRTFKMDRFEEWLSDNLIPWPRLESGCLNLESDTFRDMAKAYPRIGPLHELRHSLSEMRLNDLAVGKDGRNRCLLSPFRSKTGRNQPSNTKYIFGPSVWLRFLIRPEPGWGVAYIDWVQQEFGIAAALSGDTNMIDAYRSGDSYLTFAKLAQAVPGDATKESHKAIRDQYKQCVLGVQYGIGDLSLALRIGKSLLEARHLLKLHREIFSSFWKWSDNLVDHAMLFGRQITVFGWPNWVLIDPNPRSIRNFPMQANGAEMLRLACCFGTENGIGICAPVHDAVMITAPLERLQASIEVMQKYMREASRIVLGGFELETEDKEIRYPDHYCDDRGKEMYAKVVQLLGHSL
jgi:DNA polymerase-1